MGDFFAKEFSIGLPVAEGAAVNKSDKKLRKKIEQYPINFITDQQFLSPKYDAELAQREKLVGSNIRSEFLKAIEEGSETQKLISECLGNGLRIAVIDPIYSAQSRTKLPYGGTFQALYLTRENTIIFNSNFDGRNVIGNIVHECSHVREYAEGTSYDEQKIQTCLNNLQDFSVQVIRCMDEQNPEQEWCDHLAKLSEEYKNRQMLMHAKRIGEKQIDAGAMVTLLSTGSVSGKYENSYATMNIEPDRAKEIYALELNKITDATTKEETKPSQRQQDLHEMAMHTKEPAAYQNIPYPNPDLRNKELHASIVTYVPEQVLNEVCPDGFAVSRLDNKPITKKLNADSKTKANSGREL